MRFETTDPMTGHDVHDLETAPFVIEGSGENALKIYFESEASRRAYLEMDSDWPPRDIIAAYNKTTGQAMEM